MLICPLTLAKGKNVNFGLITLLVWMAYVKLTGPIKEVSGLKLIVRLLMRTKDDLIRTRKWGVFNFIGGINKILFGILKNEDTNYFTDKITRLGNDQMDFLKLSKEQYLKMKDFFLRVWKKLISILMNKVEK
jgi:hypothetical protein